MLSKMVMKKIAQGLQKVIKRKNNNYITSNP